MSPEHIFAHDVHCDIYQPAPSLGLPGKPCNCHRAYIAAQREEIERLTRNLGLIQSSSARLWNQKKEAESANTKLREALTLAHSFITVYAVDAAASNRKICRSCGENVAYKDHAKTCLVNSIDAAISTSAKESEG